MSSFSNFAISFSIICILSGGINSLGQATSGVGGAAIGIGWLVGCAISGVFALGLAQIASSYPTAGGLYHWASILVTVSPAGSLPGLTCSVLSRCSARSMSAPIISSRRFRRLLRHAGYAARPGALRRGHHRVAGPDQPFRYRPDGELTDFSGYLIFATAIILTVACLIAAPAMTSAGFSPLPITPARKVQAGFGRTRSRR